MIRCTCAVVSIATKQLINTCMGLGAGDALGLADDLVGGHEVLLRRDEKLLVAAPSHRMLNSGHR